MLFAERSSEVHFATILIKTPTQENRSLPRSALLFPLCFDHQISTSHQFSPSNSNLCFTNNKEQEKGNQEAESKTRAVKAKLSKVCRFEKVLATRKRQETEGPTPDRSISRGRKAVSFFCWFFFFFPETPKQLIWQGVHEFNGKTRALMHQDVVSLSGGAPSFSNGPSLQLPEIWTPRPGEAADLNTRLRPLSSAGLPPRTRLGSSLNRHRPLSLPPRPHGR